MNDKDDFWNLDRILPRKSNAASTVSRVDTVDVKNDKAPSSRGVDIRALFSAVNEKKGINSLESSIEKERDYTHFSDSRIMRYAYVGYYNSALTYENKARAYALKLFGKKPVRVPEYVEYFSFKPSFSELNSAQLEYYIYWRSEVYAGKVFPTAPSYVMLLVSEIVNLPDRIEPERGVIILVDLWEKAFDDKTRFDKLLSDTLFEYCIVHDLPIPYDRLRRVFNTSKSPVSQVLGSLYIIDFLLKNSSEFTEEDLSFVFENCLSYSFRQGKHYTTNEKFKNLLDTRFYAVLLKFFKIFPDCISKIFDNHEKRTSPIKIIKPAFLNINVSSEIKRNIVYEYYSFDKSDVEFQQLINLAKHIENKFRSECGIRARLSVNALPIDFRTALDKAILEFIIRNEPLVQKSEVKLQKKVNIDINRAISIEEASWDTTKMLTEGIEAFEDDLFVGEAQSDESSLLTDLELDVLYALLKENFPKAESLCLDAGQFFDSVASSINEKAFDSFDDIIIDINSKCVFEDYVTDITEKFFKEKK